MFHQRDVVACFRDALVDDDAFQSVLRVGEVVEAGQRELEVRVYFQASVLDVFEAFQNEGEIGREVVELYAFLCAYFPVAVFAVVGVVLFEYFGFEVVGEGGLELFEALDFDAETGEVFFFARLVRAL